LRFQSPKALLTAKVPFNLSLKTTNPLFDNRVASFGFVGL
jgi:hypothetical protein